MRFILKMLKLESTLIFTVVQVATVTGIILISPDLPEVYKRATLSCYSAGTGRAWYHQEELQTTCSDKGCLPNSKIQLGYTFTADKDKAEVTISSLDRKRDGGLWKCSAGGEQIISLDVYSFPSGLSFTRGGTTEIDLGESQTILQCQTDGCTYPAPTVRWYFKVILAMNEYHRSVQCHPENLEIKNDEIILIGASRENCSVDAQCENFSPDLLDDKESCIDDGSGGVGIGDKEDSGGEDSDEYDDDKCRLISWILVCQFLHLIKRTINLQLIQPVKKRK